jgi:hypothetical protein
MRYWMKDVCIADSTGVSSVMSPVDAAAVALICVERHRLDVEYSWWESGRYAMALHRDAHTDK